MIQLCGSGLGQLGSTTKLGAVAVLAVPIGFGRRCRATLNRGRLEWHIDGFG